MSKKYQMRERWGNGEGTVRERWGNGVQSSCLKYRCIHDNMFLFWPTEFIVFCCFNIIKILIFTGPTFFMCMCDFKSRLYVISTFISFLQLLSETRDTMFLWGWFTADSRTKLLRKTDSYLSELKSYVSFVFMLIQLITGKEILLL